MFPTCSVPGPGGGTSPVRQAEFTRGVEAEPLGTCQIPNCIIFTHTKINLSSYLLLVLLVLPLALLVLLSAAAAAADGVRIILSMLLLLLLLVVAAAAAVGLALAFGL